MAEVAAERLRFLYELNRGLTAFRDLEGLIRYATLRARELFQAEGCAVILLDRQRNELFFPIVSDSDPVTGAKVEHLRFPADRGIAGWVLEHDEATIVSDATQDPRFYNAIDRQTEMTTRSLLCSPLRSPSGNIGVIEVVNPAAGLLGSDDLEFLETIAGDVALACERTQMVESLRGEVDSLRQALRFGGLALTAVGGLFLAGAVVRHLAWALPLSELPTSPGALVGLLGIATGAGMLALSRGWLVGPTPR